MYQQRDCRGRIFTPPWYILTYEAALLIKYLVFGPIVLWTRRSKTINYRILIYILKIKLVYKNRFLFIMRKHAGCRGKTSSVSRLSGWRHNRMTLRATSATAAGLKVCHVVYASAWHYWTAATLPWRRDERGLLISILFPNPCAFSPWGGSLLCQVLFQVWRVLNRLKCTYFLIERYYHSYS